MFKIILHALAAILGSRRQLALENVALLCLPNIPSALKNNDLDYTIIACCINDSAFQGVGLLTEKPRAGTNSEILREIPA
jgi:hypothetical protein